MPFNTSKAWDIIWNAIRKADVIIEVLDARNPQGTRSRKIESFVEGEERRALIIVMNKIDMVPKNVVEQWLPILSAQHPAIGVSARIGTYVQEIKGLIRRSIESLPSPVEMDHPLGAWNVLVVGYPNSGKSTLIQQLTGNRKKLGTSSQAGFTKGVQKIALGPDLYLIDTPGIIPLEHFEEEIHQALDTCSISPQKVADKELAAEEIFQRMGLDALNKLYGIEASTYLEFIEMLGNARGMLKKGGIVREDQVHELLIRDWQKNRIPYYYIPDPANPDSRGLPRVGRIKV